MRPCHEACPVFAKELRKAVAAGLKVRLSRSVLVSLLISGNRCWCTASPSTKTALLIGVVGCLLCCLMLRADTGGCCGPYFHFIKEFKGQSIAVHGQRYNGHGHAICHLVDS